MVIVFAKKNGGGISQKIGDMWYIYIYVPLLPGNVNTFDPWVLGVFLSASELRWSLLWMLHSKALQVPHPTRLKGWELGFFIWMLKYLCHLYPKDPCEYHRRCCEGEAISPNKCCDFCCPTFLNSQAKGAPPAPFAPPVACDLALRRCPWFSGDSAAFFAGSTGSSCAGLGTASGGGTGEWGLGTHGWGAKKKIAMYIATLLLHGIQDLYNISKTTREEMLGFCRQDCSKIEEKQNNEKHKLKLKECHKESKLEICKVKHF